MTAGIDRLEIGTLDRRGEETNGVILALAKEGVAIKEIVRRTGHSRKLVRKVVRGHRGRPRIPCRFTVGRSDLNVE